MAVKLQNVHPSKIEEESFKIIESEFGPSEFDNSTFKVIQRVIHATGDFAFKENMRFSIGAIEAGIKAIREGKDIFTDVSMVASGISKGLLDTFGGSVHCKIADPDVATKAKVENKTRSEVAIDMALSDNIGIIAIGNAPTALIHAVRRLASCDPETLPLIIGVPVGFVNATESKDLLVEQNSCYITSLGRKGGSPVAAAITNALIRLAAE